MSERKWGCFKIQVRGPKKWTTLRTNRSLYFGDGYVKDESEARLDGELELADKRRREPHKEFRMTKSQEPVSRV